jgi:hypothetical protein
MFVLVRNGEAEAKYTEDGSVRTFSTLLTRHLKLLNTLLLERKSSDIFVQFPNFKNLALCAPYSGTGAGVFLIAEKRNFNT